MLDGGAVPATIAVIDGRLKVGLTRRRAQCAGASVGRHEAVARRPRLRGCRAAHRRHDGCRNDDRGRTGRHKSVCDRRHRRRPQGRGKKLRHLGRSRRAGAHAGHRGLGRRQGHPRHRKDAGGAGDARRACRRLSLRRHAGLLVADARLSGRRSGSTRRPTSRASTRRGARSASRAGCWSPIRSGPRTRSPPTRWRCTSPPRRQPPRRKRSRGKAVTPFLLSQDPRAHRRRQPEDQHRAGREQCAAGGEDRAGSIARHLDARRATPPSSS